MPDIDIPISKPNIDGAEDLIRQVVEARRSRAADVHVRPLPDGFKALQNFNATPIVCLRHGVLMLDV